MVLGYSAGVVALLAFVVLLGATMQGLVGLGLNLVSAPIVTMVTPSLMPELPLVLAVLLPFFTLARSHAEIDWHGLAWVLPFRVPGVALGVLFLALFSDEAVAVAVGAMVLFAVLLSLAPLELPVRRSDPQPGRRGLRPRRHGDLDRWPAGGVALPAPHPADDPVDARRRVHGGRRDEPGRHLAQRSPRHPRAGRWSCC